MSPTPPPPPPPAPASTAITNLLPMVTQLLGSLPQGSRAQGIRFWEEVRGQIVILEQSNIRLRAQNEVLQLSLDAADAKLATVTQALDDAVGSESCRTVSRPRTADSVDQSRYDLQALLDDESRLVLEVSSTVEQIWDLDPAWVRGRLHNDRESAAESEDPRAQQLRCWVRPRDNAHVYGYTKVNWRNTNHPRDPTRRIGCQPFRHQLAAVASGQGDSLLRTSGPEAADEVSHLCLNARCFNPDHVLVESKEMNRKRWACGGSWVVRVSDGSVYHPCPHGQEEHRRECLLPRFDIVSRGYYQNTASGPIFR